MQNRVPKFKARPLNAIAKNFRPQREVTLEMGPTFRAGEPRLREHYISAAFICTAFSRITLLRLKTNTFAHLQVWQHKYVCTTNTIPGAARVSPPSRTQPDSHLLPSVHYLQGYLAQKPISTYYWFTSCYNTYDADLGLSILPPELFGSRPLSLRTKVQVHKYIHIYMPKLQKIYVPNWFWRN